jgi:dihydrofolate reductase
LKEIVMRLSLHMLMSLDGVMQGPGGPGEDRDGDFAHGGWSVPHDDEDMGATVSGWFAGAGAFLFGRKTYEIFSNFWPTVGPGHSVADKLNTLPKYVASTTLKQLAWANSSLLGDDVPAAVTKLKELPGDELQVHGSGGLAQTLIEHDLVDEYRLLLYPVHLGTGKKLFRESTKPAGLRLISTKTTASGIIVACYEPTGPAPSGSYLDD